MASLRDFSSYVITDPCIDLKDATCVEVCPVDCIVSTPEDNQYFIDPELCIVCEQCVLVCPVEAIYLEHEVPEKWKDSIERNALFFRKAHAAVPLVSEEEAKALIVKAEARADELGIAVSIAIVDKQGTLVATGGGASPGASDGAAADKAYSAAMFERATAQLNERLLSAAPGDVDKSRLVLEPGGIPFGRPYVTGAIGIAGSTPKQDHECGRAAITAS